MNHPSLSLLIGLPVNEHEFTARFESRASQASDFLRKFDAPGAPVDVRQSHRARMWTEHYQPWVAAPALRLASAAARLGFTVVPSATFDDLMRAAEGDVVIIFSHWKGPEVAEEDFCPSFDDAAPARLSSPVGPLFDHIRTAASQPRGLAALIRKRMTWREAVRSSLDAKIDETLPGADLIVELPATTKACRRDQLDRCLEGLLVPGNRLELSDGLHSRQLVGEALMAGPKVVDLAMCTSTYLGDYLALALGGQTRTVQFPTEQEPVDAAARLVACLELTAEGLDYLAARTLVANHFERALDATLNAAGTTK